jgi:hypothetical protein
MGSTTKLVRGAMFAALVIGPVLLAAAGRCRAQAPPLAYNAYLPESNGPDSGAAPAGTITAEPPAAPSGASGSAPVSSAVPDDGWHFTASPYLWLPWLHGDVGALGRTVRVSVTPADLLSHFRFGLMGNFEARRKRLVLPIDMIYARLGDNKATPFPNLEARSASLTANMFILSPKVGYRVIDTQMFKVDALAGFRYWYFGESVHFSPSSLNFSRSQNWVDPVVGGRIQVALSPKVIVNIVGDVGGWGTGSQLEYQIGGFLGYRIKPKLTVQAGYRYLTFDYRRTGTDVGPTRLNLGMSGIGLGLTYAIK